MKRTPLQELRFGSCVATILIIGALLFFAHPRTADAHAALVSSRPAAGSVISSHETKIHLVFSEEIEISMSRLILVDVGGKERQLVPVADPHDARALDANSGELTGGKYSLRWQVLSADGHTVSGTIRFAVAGEELSPKPPAAVPIQHEAPEGSGALFSLLRGFAISALLAFAGLLFFAARERILETARPNRITSYAGLAALILLSIYLTAWTAKVSPGSWLPLTAMQTRVGRVEGARFGLAVIAFMVWMLSRRARIPAIVATGALAASAAIGHSAVVHPLWSVPLKALHLGAAATWFGGLVWILSLDRVNHEDYVREAKVVSNAAGIAVGFILVSGLVQTLLLIPLSAVAFSSTYVFVLAGKILGFIVLLAIGAYNRYRILPWLDFRVAGRDLKRTVSSEVVILGIVGILGGVLATIAPPKF